LQGVALIAGATKGKSPSAFWEFASGAQNYSANDGELSGSTPAGGMSINDAALPVAPGPEAIADLRAPSATDAAEAVEFGCEGGPDSTCQTTSHIDSDVQNRGRSVPSAGAGALGQPIVAGGIETSPDADAEASHEPAIFNEPGPEPDLGAEIADLWADDVVAAQGEAIAAPQAEEPTPFKLDAEHSDADRVGRRVTDVILDIRPTEGALPEDPAASEFARKAQSDPRQYDGVEPIVCSYTPWTICFRPLYFEEVGLERYGMKCRFIQPAVSGVHFFSSVALLPYKMRVRPPRSCVCSNGFSRVGDCPLPGYGECVWRWDAALVEAAAVTGFVFILP
jgi:hypothetical protein